MESPKHIDDITKLLLDIFPNMTLDEDRDGQLIVNTNYYWIDDGPPIGDNASYYEDKV